MLLIWFRVFLWVDDLHNVGLRDLLDVGWGGAVGMICGEMGRCFAREGDLMFGGRSDWGLRRKPGVDAVLESTSGSVVGDGLTIGKVEPVSLN
jgi:hypothetical protein